MRRVALALALLTAGGMSAAKADKTTAPGQDRSCLIYVNKKGETVSKSLPTKAAEVQAAKRDDGAITLDPNACKEHAISR